MIGQKRVSPGGKLLGTTFFALLLAMLVIWASIERPWYGMTLEGAADDGVQLLALESPLFNAEDKHPLDLPMSLLSLGHANERVVLHANDVIEEPDVFTSFVELDEFRQRQQMVFEQMQSKSLTVTLAGATGQQQTLTLHARNSRPLASLPLPFWVQLLTGMGGFLIGAWVLVLRPKDAAARYFMLTGVSLMLAAFSAAIYSTRELALPAEWMHWLMWINHAGSVGFGFSLLGLFLYFPQRLASRHWTVVLAALYLLWLVMEFAELGSSPQALVYLPVLALSGLILLLIALQWWNSRGKPKAIAALRWLGLVTLITICCFLVLAALPVLFDAAPIVSQGSAFGFFLILYAGFALGLKRYKLFELDRWAYHVLLWVLAGVALVGLDLALLTLMHWQQQTSLLVSLLLCGFLYLPLRGWLWQWLVERPKPDSRSLFNRIVEIALAPSQKLSVLRWQALLEQLYDPLHSEPGINIEQPEASLDGQSLHIPAVFYAPAITLVLAEKGRRLFQPADVKLALEIIDMLSYVTENRQAFQSGARQERVRIAQDLHDDLGSRLLTGLHQSTLPEVRDTIGMALAEMRSIVRGLAGKALPLEQLLAELREESMVRCEGAGIALHWPLPPTELSPALDYYTYRHLLSIIRELFSNIIRHSGASHVEMDVQLQSQQLYCKLYDDGCGFDGSGSGGNGLSNLQGRIAQLAGSLIFEPQAKGTLVCLQVPLPASGDMEREA